MNYHRNLMPQNNITNCFIQFYGSNENISAQCKIDVNGRVVELIYNEKIYKPHQFKKENIHFITFQTINILEIPKT